MFSNRRWRLALIQNCNHDEVFLQKIVIDCIRKTTNKDLVKTMSRRPRVPEDRKRLSLS